MSICSSCFVWLKSQTNQILTELLLNYVILIQVKYNSHAINVNVKNYLSFIDQIKTETINDLPDHPHGPTGSDFCFILKSRDGRTEGRTDTTGEN